MAAIRITSVNFNNQSANITFYSENNPDVPVNLGLNIIPYTRFGNDIFGRYVLSFPAYGSVCEASISSPTTTTTTTSGPTTTLDPSITTTTTISPSDFSMSHYSEDIVITITGTAIVDFDDGDSRIVQNATATKNYWKTTIGYTLNGSANRSWNSTSMSDDGDIIYVSFDYIDVNNKSRTVILKSVDGGTIFTTYYISGAYDFSSSLLGSLASFGGDAYFLALSNNFRKDIFLGNSNLSVSLSAHNWTDLACSSDGSKLVAVSTAGQLSGKIFTLTSSSGFVDVTPIDFRNWQSVSSDSTGNKLVAGNSINIYTSTDGGVNWTQRTLAASYVSSSSDGEIIAAAQNNGLIYISSDGGATWTSKPQAGSRSWRKISISGDGSKIVAITSGGNIYDGQIFTSFDGGETWFSREVKRNWKSISISRNGNRIVAAAENPAEDDKIYIKDTNNFNNKNVIVSGSYSNISFPQSLGVHSVNSWGSLTTLNNTFGAGFPSLSTIPSFQGLFSARSLIRNVTDLSGTLNINSTSLQDITGILQNNLSITNVNLNAPSLTNATSAFAGSKISSINITHTSQLNQINGMFNNCTNLDQDFTGFSLAGITFSTRNINNFMSGTTKLSNANYNKLLVYWDQNKASYRNDIIIGMGQSVADTTSGGVNGILAKFNLLVYGWTITDGG
jgi:hypothetical protein